MFLMRLPVNNFYYTLNIKTKKYKKIRRIYDKDKKLLMYTVVTNNFTNTKNLNY